LLCLVAGDSRSTHMVCVLVGAAKETVLKDVLKPHKRQEASQQRKKFSWVRPATIRNAFLVAKLLGQIAKVIAVILELFGK
jgi:hypothetical protein